jgi:hypothetical protein
MNALINTAPKGTKRFTVQKGESSDFKGNPKRVYNIYDTQEGYIVDTCSLLRDAKFFANRWNNELK